MKIKKLIGSILTKYLVQRLRIKLFLLAKHYIKENSNILDIGCGVNGTINYNKLPKKINLYFVDLNKDYLKKASEKYSPKKALLGDLMKINLQKKFDVVFYAGVIQYIKKPEESLKKIRSLLSEKGVLIIATINKKSILRRLGLITTKPKKSNVLGYSEEHLYTEEELRKLLVKTGFKILSNKFTDNYAPLGADLILIASKNVG